MIDLEKFKESLGDIKNELSEEEILRLRKNQDEMSEIFFNLWLNEISSK